MSKLNISSKQSIDHVVKVSLLALSAAALFSGSAFAQSQSSEAVPQTNTKPQIAAEAKKNRRASGTAPIKDGSTAEGQGSGVKKTNKAEARGQNKASAREALPHTEGAQGGTPK